MTVSLRSENDGKILSVRVSGKLTRDDYQNLTPQFEERIAQHGKIRLLFEMVDFHGWEMPVWYEGIKAEKIEKKRQRREAKTERKKRGEEAEPEAPADEE